MSLHISLWGKNYVKKIGLKVRLRLVCVFCAEHVVQKETSRPIQLLKWRGQCPYRWMRIVMKFQALTQSGCLELSTRGRHQSLRGLPTPGRLPRLRSVNSEITGIQIQSDNFEYLLGEFLTAVIPCSLSICVEANMKNTFYAHRRPREGPFHTTSKHPDWAVSLRI